MPDAHPSPRIKIRRASRLAKMKATEKTGPEVKSSSNPTPPNKRARPEGQDQGIESEDLISKSEPQAIAGQDQVQGMVPEPQTLAVPEEKKPDKWIHFGPTFGKDTELNQKAKDSAWLHIVAKKRGSVNDYMRSIEEIGKEAMDCYDKSIVDGATVVPDEFVELMAKDGCFFLQLALHILGAGALLGYPLSNPYFGEGSDPSSYIAAMFFVGNQIPYVVINALMKQSFFGDVIKTGKLNQYPKAKSDVDLAKLALYRTVVEPQLRTKVADRPSNVLEALHNLLLGSRAKNPISPTREFQDLEIGIEDSETKFPNVGELKKSGIRLRKAKRGVTNIQFSNYFFLTFLHVPPLTIDGRTKDLLTSLVDFEQFVSESDRGVTAYIRFIKELAPTYRDLLILIDKGIIHVKAGEKLKSTNVVQMLDNLITPNKSNFTPNFRLIRRKIEQHKRPPWGIIGGIISFFTIVQTVLAIVAYVKPRT